MTKSSVQKKVKKAVKIGKKGREIKSFPKKLLVPIGKFLQNKLKSLEKKKKVIEEEDPFNDKSRLFDNASPDADAAEQFGHAKTNAIKREIDRKIIQTRKALSRVKVGKYGICEDCNKMIDTDRLVIYPEATLCAACKKKREK